MVTIIRTAVDSDAPKIVELKKLQAFETEGVETFDDETVLKGVLTCIGKPKFIKYYLSVSDDDEIVGMS